jgi:hypothetical protein
VYPDADIIIGNLGEWHCSRSGVGARSWSVCFGDTVGWTDKAFTNGGANGHDLLFSPAL